MTQDCVIVGDIHGHILDLFRIFSAFGLPPQTRYAFLGDFVDRGEFSTETAVFLLCMKVLWPSSIILIRGNHEFRDMWKYGFEKELEELYPCQNAASLFEEAFAYMPLAAVVHHRFLCLHGGIGPGLRTLSDIRNVFRPVISYNDETVSDILWSDPSESIATFLASPRGTGHMYGEEALREFLSSNGLQILVRGHESVDGISHRLGGKVVTVFSASSYCNVLKNSAAVLQLCADGSSTPRSFPPIRHTLRCDAVFLASQTPNAFKVNPMTSIVRKEPRRLPSLRSSANAPQTTSRRCGGSRSTECLEPLNRGRLFEERCPSSGELKRFRCGMLNPSSSSPRFPLPGDPVRPKPTRRCSHRGSLSPGAGIPHAHAGHVHHVVSGGGSAGIAGRTERIVPDVSSWPQKHGQMEKKIWTVIINSNDTLKVLNSKEILGN
jgi:protein phosphatase